MQWPRLSLAPLPPYISEQKNDRSRSWYTWVNSIFIGVTFCCYLLKKCLPPGLIGTKTFRVVERIGAYRGPQHGAGWSCVLQVLPAERPDPDQEGYLGHDGAVRIDRQVYNVVDKWYVLCTLSTEDTTSIPLWNEIITFRSMSSLPPF